MTGNIKVVFLPDNGDHPYQEALKRELALLGVEVVPGLRPLLFPLLASAFKHRPDIIHLHWLNPFLIGRNAPVSLVKSLLFTAELLLCRAAGIKLVWTLHNIVNHEKVHSGIDLFFSGLVARLADRVIVHSNSAIGEMGRAYRLAEPRAEVVPLGVDMPSVGQNERSKARETLGFNSDDRVFLYFGNIRRYKGVTELLAAFARVPGGNLRLLVVGRPHDDALRAGVETAAAQDARLKLHLDFVPEAVAAHFFLAADAVVLPYLGITTSGVLLLAMSYGKPVIAPALPFMTEILGPDAGILYGPSEPDGLAAALAKTAKADLHAQGRLAAERAAACGWSSSAATTLEIYREVCGRISREAR